MRKAVEIHLTAEQEKKLRTWATGRKHARWLTERAKVILHAVAGLSNIEISRLVDRQEHCGSMAPALCGARDSGD